MINSLYDIKTRFVELMNNDELTEEQVQELGVELAQELKNKSTNIIAYIINSESLLERMKMEEERLKSLRKLGEEKIEKFKKYVKENMETLGLQKIQTELGNLMIAKNPISVEIIDEDKIPKEFKEEVTTIKINKKAISDYFKETGEIVDGVNIVSDKTSLRVK